MSQAKSPLLGRPMAAQNVRRIVGKLCNRAAYSLTEAVLARALAGDPVAQRSAVELLKLGLSHDDK